MSTTALRVRVLGAGSLTGQPCEITTSTGTGSVLVATSARVGEVVSVEVPGTVGRCLVQATSGQAWAWAHMPLDGQVHDLTLQAARVDVWRLELVEGEPAPGVEVLSRLPGGATTVSHGRTDEEGHVRVPEVAHAMLVAYSPALGPVTCLPERVFRDSPPITRWVLFREQPTPRRVALVDPDMAPVEGRLIWHGTFVARTLEPAQSFDLLWTTDEHRDVTVTAPGYWERELPLPGVPPAGSVERVVLTPFSGKARTTHCVDATTGEPLVQAWALPVLPRAWTPSVVRADTNGRLVLPVPPEDGEAWLRFEADGYRPAVLRFLDVPLRVPLASDLTPQRLLFDEREGVWWLTVRLAAGGHDTAWEREIRIAGRVTPLHGLPAALLGYSLRDGAGRVLVRWEGRGDEATQTVPREGRSRLLSIEAPTLRDVADARLRLTWQMATSTSSQVVALDQGAARVVMPEADRVTLRAEWPPGETEQHERIPAPPTQAHVRWDGTPAPVARTVRVVSAETGEALSANLSLHSLGQERAGLAVPLDGLALHLPAQLAVRLIVSARGRQVVVQESVWGGTPEEIVVRLPEDHTLRLRWTGSLPLTFQFATLPLDPTLPSALHGQVRSGREVTLSVPTPGEYQVFGASDSWALPFTRCSTRAPTEITLQRASTLVIPLTWEAAPTRETAVDLRFVYEGERVEVGLGERLWRLHDPAQSAWVAGFTETAQELRLDQLVPGRGTLWIRTRTGEVKQSLELRPGESFRAEPVVLPAR